MATSDEPHKLVVQIGEQDLLCANKCGFFGNPEWEGFCSKCYREQEHVSARAQHYNKNRTILKFDKFEEKRRQQTDKRASTFKSALFGKGSKHDTEAAASSTAVSRQQHHRKKRSLSPESSAVREKLLAYLQTLPRPLAQELSKTLTNAVEKILYEFSGSRMDELSELVQDLYSHVNDRLTAQKIADLDVDVAMNHVEQYICVRVFHSLFCASTDEEVSDLSLQERIRSLHWVTSGFLETGLDFTEPGVRDRVDEAITEMIDLNSYRQIDAKLACLLRCCNLIFLALKLSKGPQGSPASADDFLPVLIYVIVKCNPPLLQSNLKYISRFAIPSKVDTGETGYFFTNLCCAVKFVQNLNADSLRMQREEFEAYTSGQLIAPATEENTRCHELIKVMENTGVRLDGLSEQVHALLQRMEQFELHTKRETDRVIAIYDECAQKYAPAEDFDTYHARVLATLDAEHTLTTTHNDNTTDTALHGDTDIGDSLDTN